MTNNNDQLPHLEQYLRAACLFVIRADGLVLGVTVETSLADIAGIKTHAAHAPSHYTWGTPGGGCEGLESPDDCARRELYEETGYVAGSLVPVHVAIHTSKSGKKVLTSGYMAHVVAQDALAPRGAPGEGFAAWVAPQYLLRGPYATFNAAVLAKVGLG